MPLCAILLALPPIALAVLMSVQSIWWIWGFPVLFIGGGLFCAAYGLIGGRFSYTIDRDTPGYVLTGVIAIVMGGLIVVPAVAVIHILFFLTR